jgi:hypothetical protein
MRIAYIGNFGPPHSTENDIRQTLVDMHVEVDVHQEDYSNSWRHLTGAPHQYDAIFWTSTRDLAERIGRGTQLEMLYQARRRGIPTIGFHLDRWWGLQRWRTVLEAPFFRCEYVFTADGAHQEEFAAAGVNHHWSPPAIAPRNVRIGDVDPRWRCDIAFVGSWQGGYHQEWQHRPQLVDFLRKTYGKRVRFFPEKGQHRIVGNALADLYATAKVVVGDSCLVPTVSGEPMHHYCSDRVFETLGRGGLLIHPMVEGVVDSEAAGRPLHLLTRGLHLEAWPLGDWSDLKWRIDEMLTDEDSNLALRREGYSEVARFHTYANRLEKILGQVGLEDYTPLKLELPPQVAR